MSAGARSSVAGSIPGSVGNIGAIQIHAPIEGRRGIGCDKYQMPPLIVVACGPGLVPVPERARTMKIEELVLARVLRVNKGVCIAAFQIEKASSHRVKVGGRSEERRVGKEYRARGSKN